MIEVEEGEQMADRSPRRLRFFGRPTFGGAVIGLVFAWRALLPTLLPRSWVVQAAVSAICIAVGYAIGTLAGRVGHLLLQRYGREPDASVKRTAWWAVGGGALVVVVLTVLQWPASQNDQRDLVDMDPVARAVTAPMLVSTVVLLVVLVLIGRLIGRGVQRLHRFNLRHLPSPVAIPVTVVLVAVIASFVLRDVAVTRFTSWANSAFGTIDDGTNEGTVRPETELASGGPGSLVDWDTLGVQGRDFVAQATPVARIAGFHGRDGSDGDEVQEPIRVYTGLRSADSVQERAALAVEELERTGAFEREVLVIATTTGTGWIDPDAIEALEMIFAGDAATVGMQYSFLPSWISTLVDKGNATEAGAVLYDAVHRRWAELPEGDRPKLLAFGLSLGSYGGEAPFVGVDAATSVANLVARSDGALFVGPTNDNVIWNQVTDARDVGTPVWWPVVDGGESVRFTTRGPDPHDLPADWEAPRVLYVQHPSDPVTFWSMDSFWRRSEWMASPTGYDVPDRGGWFPIVTGTQGVFDLMAGFSAPPGFGHDYRLDYVDAWVQVAQPEGWTEGDTDRLEALLHVDPEG